MIFGTVMATTPTGLAGISHFVCFPTEPTRTFSHFDPKIGLKVVLISHFGINTVNFCVLWVWCRQGLTNTYPFMNDRNDRYSLLYLYIFNFLLVLNKKSCHSCHWHSRYGVEARYFKNGFWIWNRLIGVWKNNLERAIQGLLYVVDLATFNDL